MSAFRRSSERVGRGAAFCALGVGLSACGPASGPSSPPLPAALVLRIDRVEVSSTRQASQVAWDGDEAATDPGAGCKVLVAGATFFVPSLAPVSSLCGLARGPQRERHAREPDLQVRLGARVNEDADVVGPRGRSDCVTAERSPEKVAEASRTVGVLHVEAERKVSVPSPGSKVQ
jgi:hypothetical protein